MRRYLPLTLLVIAYLIVGSLYAIYTPDWQAPDEPAHYNYIRQLASGHFPIIEPGDYDQAYQAEVISSQFDPQFSVEPFEYEDYQPPLYYLLQTPQYWLFDGDLTILRLTSVFLGVGVVILTYVAAQILFPNNKWLAPTAAAFVAFLPQHIAILGSVNNDSLAELIIAGILVMLLMIATNGKKDGENNRIDRKLLILGLLLGLGFLTKVTVYILVPVITLTLLWKYWGRWRILGRSSLIVFGPAFIIGLIWWARNLFTYGGLDFLGTIAHNTIVVGQPRTTEWIAEKGLGETLLSFIQTTFQSFWGQFGWMGVVMPSRVYQLLLVFTGVTFLGLLLLTLRGWTNPTDRRYISTTIQRKSLPLIILAATVLLSILVYLLYNLTFVQHQGRYLFPALMPIALAVAVSWGILARPLFNRWAESIYLLPIGFAIALITLDLVALFKFIVPALT